jgi:hypothetical protein
MRFDPSSIEGTIFWGVVAGVLASALLFVLGLIAQKIVLPWYEAFIFKGVDLRGIWVQEYDAHGAHYAVQMLIEQRAHRISGSASITKSGSGLQDYVQLFTVEGSTWEGFLTLSLQSTNRKSLSFVAGLVKVKDRGNSLVGHWVYRGGVTDEAEAEVLHLVRKA